MAFINNKAKEINCKIVYYGPPQSGKSTSLRYIYDQVQKKRKGEPLTLNTGEERTLYFDFVPLDLGKIKDYSVRVHLYTVPGEMGYRNARELTSMGLDGAVFVADSTLTRLEANLASLKGLRDVLAKEGHDLAGVPLVIQFNKRDLKNAAPVKELSEALHADGVPHFETIATDGTGVMEALTAIAKKVLTSLKRQSVSG